MKLDRYIGIPYDPRNFDCADFVILLQRELFNRNVTLPADRPRVGMGQRHTESMSQEFAERTDTPQDGDLVLMKQLGKKRPGHVGVYFMLHYEPWVLHCNEDDGQSVAHRMRELPDFNIQPTGFYRWKTNLS